MIILLISLIFTGCGPSQQEIESREKTKMDSIAKITSEQLERREKDKMDSVAQATAGQIEKQRTTQEAALAETKRNKEHSDSLNQQLIHLKAKLEVAESKLHDTKQFQILRTADEKAAQIQRTKEEVEQIKLEISKVESELQMVKF